MPAHTITSTMVDGRKVTTVKIQFDQVTSGKLENGIFSVCYKKKQIDVSPFKLKEANSMYNCLRSVDLTEPCS